MINIIHSFINKTLIKRIIISAITVLTISVMPTLSFAQQTGTVSGKVIDSSSGSPMIGVNVIIRSLGVYDVTDVNGNYTLTGVTSGDHQVEYQMSGYERSVTNALVIPGRNTKINIGLSFSTASEIIVSAKRVSNTEASLLAKRKKAAVAQDAISSEQISKSPDSDASDAAKRVTGVTIVNGKTVFVRGLGERYSSVSFAGSTIPSPNPDKRIVPMDIFPTALLDNLIIVKAYTPDMPGEFAGGIVQINPKDYPDEGLCKVTLGTGFHMNTTMKNFNTYDGGKYDFAGFDDGTRKMPSAIKDKRLTSANYTPAQIEKAGQSFKNEYTPKKEKAMFPLSASITCGDSYKLGSSNTFGFLLSGMFKEDSKNKEIEIKRYTDQGTTNLEQKISQSTYSTGSGGLFSAGFTSSMHKLRLTSFYSHQSEDKTSVYKGYNGDRQEPSIDGAASSEKRYKLQYIEEGLFFNQFAGEHHVMNRLILEYMGSYSKANRYEPDTRTTQLIDINSTGDYGLYRPDDVRRFFQQHDDTVYEINPALTIMFKQWGGLDTKLKLGGGYMSRERNSRARTFIWAKSPAPSSGEAVAPIENLYTNNSIGGSNDEKYFINEQSAETDKYTGKLQIAAGFAQLDIPLYSQLRVVGGVRYENADMDLITFNPTKGKETNLEKEPLERHNIMPGAGLTYSATNNMNLRLAFSKTVARPDFREVSEYKYPSMLSSEMIKGNTELVQTDIYNYDTRFEWFPSPYEIAAFSIFYKRMLNPIEVLEISTTAGSALYKSQNAVSADNVGAEIEFRKSLKFISPIIEDFSFGSNLAYIYSRINVKDSSDTDYTTNDRALQGQSPFIVNSSINYDNEKLGYNIGLLYNINGRRIVRVGTINNGVKRGDIYEEPTGKMDFVAQYKITKNATMKFTASNLLDPEIRETQKRENAATGKMKEYTLEKSSDGRNFGLSASYSF